MTDVHGDFAIEARRRFAPGETVYAQIYLIREDPLFEGFGLWRWAIRDMFEYGRGVVSAVTDAAVVNSQQEVLLPVTEIGGVYANLYATAENAFGVWSEHPITDTEFYEVDVLVSYSDGLDAGCGDSAGTQIYTTFEDGIPAVRLFVRTGCDLLLDGNVLAHELGHVVYWLAQDGELPLPYDYGKPGLGDLTPGYHTFRSKEPEATAMWEGFCDFFAAAAFFEADAALVDYDIQRAQGVERVFRYIGGDVNPSGVGTWLRMPLDPSPWDASPITDTARAGVEGNYARFFWDLYDDDTRHLWGDDSDPVGGGREDITLPVDWFIDVLSAFRTGTSDHARREDQLNLDKQGPNVYDFAFWASQGQTGIDVFDLIEPNGLRDSERD